MADREQLAARLVEAAVRAIAEAGFVDPEDGCMPTFVDRAYPESRISTWRRPQEAVKPALVAVLRELADELLRGMRANVQPGVTVAPTVPLLLRGLADYIEKGAGDGQH